MNTLVYSYALLAGVLVGLVCILRGFSYRHIFLLTLGGAFLVTLIQMIYISFGRGFHVDFIFVSGIFQFNNYIEYIENAFGKNPGGSGYVFLFASLIAAAIVEELGKFYIFKKIGDFLGILTGIRSTTLAIIYVAIGFSILETGFYAYFLYENSIPHVMGITSVRAVLGTLSHILFSAIIGYSYAKARFIEFDMIDNLEIGKTNKILKKLKNFPFIHIRTLSVYYATKYIFYGFSLSILLHALYNFFMKTNNEIFAILTIAIGALVFFQMMIRSNPNESYQALKNKISYLRELKELKAKMNESSHIQK